MIKKIVFTLFVFIQLATFSQDYDFGKVSKEELQEKFYPLDSTADAAYLYRERKTTYSYDKEIGFNVITDVYERIKIYSKEGLKKANKLISYYEPEIGERQKVRAIKAYTFNLDKGKLKKEKLSKKDIFDEEKNKFWSVKKMAMPSAKEGSVLEIAYKIISPYYYGIDDLQFQFDIPVKKLAYKVTVPEYFTFKQKNKGYYYVTPESTRSRGSFQINSSQRKTTGFGSVSISYSNNKIDYVTNVLEYNQNNIPALKDNEPYVSNINNYRGGVKFELESTDFIKVGGDLKHYSATWENVSKEIYRSSGFGAELDKSSYFKDDLANVIADTESDFQKVTAIFQFVKSKVKWNNYVGKYTDQGVRKAYKENSGNVADINLILTAMLREAGLNANPVLISTRDNGIPFFPTLEGFNYVISMVEFSDNTYVLLDATEPYSLPNVLPVRDLNWSGRKVLKNGNSVLVKLNSPEPAAVENIVMIKFTDDFVVKGMIRTTFENLSALNFRTDNNHLKEENLITKYEEDNNIIIEDFKVANSLDLSKPVVRTVKFESEDLVEAISGKLYIEPLLFLSKHENPFKLAERKYPVDFDAPWKEESRVSIEIPKGYSVEKLPESLEIALPNNLGVFVYKIVKGFNAINVFSSLQVNADIIDPQYYPSLKEFYNQLVLKQSEKIVLIKE
jgi:hypothetical protein